MSELPLRDDATNPELYFQAPGQDDLNARYKGMSFQEFQQFSTDDVELYEEAATTNWEAVCGEYSVDDQEFTDAFDEMKVFWNFIEWRKYGIPDRDLSYEDFYDYMKHCVSYRSKKDPTYGRITPNLEAQLVDDLGLVEALLSINYGDGEPEIGKAELQSLCGLHDSTIDNLIDKGVLRIRQNYERVWIQPNISYGLREPYLGIYLASQYALEREIDVLGRHSESVQSNAIVLPLSLAKWLGIDETEPRNIIEPEMER